MTATDFDCRFAEIVSDYKQSRGPQDLREFGRARMKVVCAWCQRDLREIPCAPEQHGQVSHGICPACSTAVLGAACARH